MEQSTSLIEIPSRIGTPKLPTIDMAEALNVHMTYLGEPDRMRFVSKLINSDPRGLTEGARLLLNTLDYTAEFIPKMAVVINPYMRPEYPFEFHPRYSN